MVTSAMFGPRAFSLTHVTNRVTPKGGEFESFIEIHPVVRRFANAAHKQTHAK